MTRIVVVEDEPGIADFVARGLTAGGFAVQVAHDGERGEQLALGDEIGLVVLDLMLPRRSGRDVLRTLAARRPGLPVIVLTARGEVRDRVDGLSAGAVDYLVKPFAMAELEARVRAHLRTTQLASEVVAGDGRLRVDLIRRTVLQDGTPVRLSSREFELLTLFLNHRGRVLTRPFILQAVWGTSHDPGTNLVDVYIGYLRRKLSTDARRGPVVITTVRSQGYRLEEA